MAEGLPGSPPVIALRTARLQLRQMAGGDAPFILQLLNDPDWLRHIGDKKVRNLDDARAYIENGPRLMYVKRIGLWGVAPLGGGALLGMCGLIKRDSLPELDLGFAFLPAARGQGYAREAAQACLDYARGVLRAPCVLAITSPDNERSARVLEAAGLRFDQLIRLPPQEAPLRLYRIAWPAGNPS